MRPKKKGRSKKTENKVEVIKKESDYLRGGLPQEVDNDALYFDNDTLQLLKFHGTYQQDDRDVRKGRDKHWMFMIRGRVPGGKLTAKQYLAIDAIADKYANGAIRATTRQAFQLHGVIKKELKQTIAAINASLITTLGACGDVVRNVMATPAPDIDGRQSQVQAFANDLSDTLLPASHAYHEVWLDGDKIYSGKQEIVETEPLYGDKYLPRKFKIAITLPGDNSVDVYTQDIGLVALFDEQNRIEGFNVIVGGGMGMSHRKPETFPRLGDDLGYITKENVVPLSKAIIGIQRDYGNRINRKRARMKYLIDEWGIEKFKTELQKRIDFTLHPYRDLPEFDLDLYLGWNRQSDDNWFLGLSIENGRIKDDEALQLRTVLRKVVGQFNTGVRFTANQNILLTDIKAENKSEIEQLLHEHGVVFGEELSNLLKYSMACPALPTCGLALTESERVFPEVIRKLEKVVEELELEQEKLSVRMTGCPNGCARPYVADIGFVGRSRDKYSIFIGGNPAGTRLNTRYKDMVPFEELIPEARLLLTQFKNERYDRETFGDFWNRVGIPEADLVTA